MRSKIGIIGLALLAAACTRDPLFFGSPRSTHEPLSGHDRSHSSGDDGLTPGEHVYLTAVRFPDGYAWDLDTCAVEGEVWIDLYRDGEKVRSIPAGASVHPDMHRYLGGHLYTDWSTDTETFVAREGTELFRFEGREALRGFLVREDGVHTLGQDRDGNGFTLTGASCTGARRAPSWAVRTRPGRRAAPFRNMGKMSSMSAVSPRNGEKNTT